jgi:hypothetical protein
MRKRTHAEWWEDYAYSLRQMHNDDMRVGFMTATWLTDPQCPYPTNWPMASLVAQLAIDVVTYKALWTAKAKV